MADQQGMGLLSRMVHNQAREMAYLDPVWVFAIMALAGLPLILLVKKAVARSGVAMHCETRGHLQDGCQTRASVMLRITIDDSPRASRSSSKDSATRSPRS